MNLALAAGRSVLARLRPRVTRWLVALLAVATLSPCKSSFMSDDEEYRMEYAGCVAEISNPPKEEERDRLRVVFAANAGVIALYRDDPYFGGMVSSLADGMRTGTPVRYTFRHARNRLRLTSAVLSSAPSEPFFGLPSTEFAPKAHRRTSVYEGMVRGVGVRERFWVKLDDATFDTTYPGAGYHLDWGLLQSRQAFDVLMEHLLTQTPVRVTYYTADGEIIEVEGRTP